MLETHYCNNVMKVLNLILAVCVYTTNSKRDLVK